MVVVNDELEICEDFLLPHGGDTLVAAVWRWRWPDEIFKISESFRREGSTPIVKRPASQESEESDSISSTTASGATGCDMVLLRSVALAWGKEIWFRCLITQIC
jgi:hypothetical protein